MSDFDLTPPPGHDPRRAPNPSAGPRDGADETLILRALAMAWSPRHRKWLIDVLRRLDLRTGRGVYFGQADVDDSLMALAGRGLVARSDQGWQCTTDHRIGQFRLALAAPEFRRWREAILAADGSAPTRGWFQFSGMGTAVTVARLAFYGGDDVDRWRLIEQAGQHLPDWGSIIDQVVLTGFCLLYTSRCV